MMPLGEAMRFYIEAAVDHGRGLGDLRTIVDRYYGLLIEDLLLNGGPIGNVYLAAEEYQECHCLIDVATGLLAVQVGQVG